MTKEELLKLALPASIIIAATILYLGMTNRYRECIDGSTRSGYQIDIAKSMCAKP